MKKTLLALTVTSIFSAGAMATNDFTVVSKEELTKQTIGWSMKTDIAGNKIVVDAKGNEVGHASIEHGQYVIQNHDTGEQVRVNEDGTFDYFKEGSSLSPDVRGEIVEKIDSNWKPNNDVIVDDIRKSAVERADQITENLDALVNSGQEVVIDGTRYSADDLIHMKATIAHMSDAEKQELVEKLDPNMDITIVDGNNSNWKPNNDTIHDDSNRNADKVNEQVEMIVDGLDAASNANQKVVIEDSESGQRIELSGQDLVDAKNAIADMSEAEKAQFFEEIKEDHIKVTVDDESSNEGANNGGSNKVIDQDTRNGEISTEVDKRIAAADQKVRQEAAAYATAVDNKLANHEGRISGLEKDMKEMGNKMLVLEDRMDGVVASSHAITNARPVLSQAGQYGVGVGVGHAGSKQAVALGGAMQFTENWSGSMSVNYETKGKVSSDQFSAGVGAQYVF